MERMTVDPDFNSYTTKWIVKEFNLRKAMSFVSLDGLFLEFGVYKGQSINFIAKSNLDKTIFGFDGWWGLPEEWTTDKITHPVGYLSVGGKLPKVYPNVTLVSGMFEDTLPAFVGKHHEPVAFVHIDCDLYSSTKTILTHLSPLLVAGSIVVFDEWSTPDVRIGHLPNG